MKKDAYYFPHFSNARNDSKIIKLRRIIGIEGYAIYFMLLEILREQTNYKYPLSGIEDLAYEWHTSKEKIFSVISNFELFEVDEQNFFSTKLILYLQPYIEKSQRATLAAEKRWQTVKNQVLEENINNANAMQMHIQMQSKCNASKVKESKVKESKVKESKLKHIAIISEIEFLNYCQEFLKQDYQAYEISLRAKYNAWAENGWVDGYGKPILNWKTKIQNTLPYLKKVENQKFIKKDSDF